MKTKKQLKDFVKNAGKKFLLTKFEVGYTTEKVCVLTGNQQGESFELKVLSTKYSDGTTSDKQYDSWTMIPTIDHISFNPDCNDFTFRFNGITLCFNFYEGN